MHWMVGPDDHRSGLKQIRLLIDFPRVECWPGAVNSFHKYSDGLQMQVGMHDTSATVSADVRLQYRSLQTNNDCFHAPLCLLHAGECVCACCRQHRIVGYVNGERGKVALRREANTLSCDMHYFQKQSNAGRMLPSRSSQTTSRVKKQALAGEWGQQPPGPPIWHNRFFD